MSLKLRHVDRKRSAARGFAAIAAIFLVVILAALGAFMVTFSNTQQITSAQDALGTRAYWAARAGLEWGVGKASAVSNPATLGASTCSTSAPLTVDGFAVTVSCGVKAYAEGSADKYVVQITSVAKVPATSPGAVGYIERSVSASTER